MVVGTQNNGLLSYTPYGFQQTVKELFFLSSVHKKLIIFCGNECDECTWLMEQYLILIGEDLYPFWVHDTAPAIKECFVLHSTGRSPRYEIAICLQNVPV